MEILKELLDEMKARKMYHKATCEVLLKGEKEHFEGREAEADYIIEKIEYLIESNK